MIRGVTEGLRRTLPGCECHRLTGKVFTGINTKQERELGWKSFVWVMARTRFVSRMRIWGNHSSSFVRGTHWILEVWLLCGHRKRHRVRCHFSTALPSKVEISKLTCSRKFYCSVILSKFWNFFRVHFTILLIPLVSPQIYVAYLLFFWDSGQFLKYLFHISLTWKMSLAIQLK